MKNLLLTGAAFFVFVGMSAAAQDYYIETTTDWAGIERLKLSFPETHGGVGLVSGVAVTDDGNVGFVGSCWNDESESKPLQCQINYDAHGTVLLLDLWPLQQIFVGGNAGTAVLQGSNDISGLNILALDERSSIGPPGPQGPKGEKGDSGNSTATPEPESEPEPPTDPEPEPPTERYWWDCVSSTEPERPVWCAGWSVSQSKLEADGRQLVDCSEAEPLRWEYIHAEHPLLEHSPEDFPSVVGREGAALYVSVEVDDLQPGAHVDLAFIVNFAHPRFPHSRNLRYTFEVNNRFPIKKFEVTKGAGLFSQGTTKEVVGVREIIFEEDLIKASGNTYFANGRFLRVSLCSTSPPF